MTLVELDETTPRNLTHAFEALCSVEASDANHHDDEPDDKTSKKRLVPLISPSSVALDAHTPNHHSKQHRNEKDDALSSLLPNVTMTPTQQTYTLTLPPDLVGELSPALIHRVAFYSVIHDINKEASAMAQADTLAVACPSVGTDADEHSPLVVAAKSGTTKMDEGTVATAADTSQSTRSKSYQHEACCMALLDEEEWLLETVSSREPTEQRACPETYLQAIGEKEYENPVISLAGNTRTQLWKPSRSWWEAKSGKNPWIEPSLHNKRWRYLWPLIHYHKFLAKCIKKLKRNGVDVKQSVSPVAVFLREEVCAVSDHLAALSLYDSDEWMACLPHFNGWCPPESESYYRSAISALKLRAVEEPCDVDSTLLRSQVDEHFLRSMANARAQLRENAEQTSYRTSKKDSIGQPPVYPRESPAVPKHIVPKQGSGEPRRQRSWKAHQNQHFHGQHPQWWTPQQHWEHRQMQGPPGYCDSSSVQSTLSVDSYPTMHPTMYHPHQPVYHHPYSQNAEMAHISPALYSYPEQGIYDPGMHHAQGPWIDPSMMYQVQMQGHYPPAGTCPVPVVTSSPEAKQSQEHVYPPHLSPTGTPEKVMSPEDAGLNSSMSQSPFWSHLDRATMAMGLATPAKASPLTPRRRGEDKFGDDLVASTDANAYALNAQPLLLQHNQYYGSYSAAPYGAPHDGYGPPSPATQFMMSPQNGFAYNYGYSFSPNRKVKSTPRANRRMPRSTEGSPSGADNTSDLIPPPDVRKGSSNRDRESPSTIETTAESESLHEYPESSSTNPCA